MKIILEKDLLKLKNWRNKDNKPKGIFKGYILTLFLEME